MRFRRIGHGCLSLDGEIDFILIALVAKRHGKSRQIPRLPHLANQNRAG
jgi:hypothetical protein